MSDDGLPVVDVEVSEAQSLKKVRVPTVPIFEVFRPVQPVQLDRIQNRTFICFGTTGLFGRILIDSESGAVVEIHEGETSVKFVNSSIEKFVECLNFFSLLLSGAGGEPDGDSEELADQLESAIRRIDSDAYTEGRFWYEIRWDVSLGDFN